MVLGSSLFDQLLHLSFLLSLIDRHLLNDGGRLLLVLLLHVDVALVSFGDLRVEDLLQLITILLRHQVLVVVLVDELVSLKLLDDLLRVKVIVV